MPALSMLNNMLDGAVGFAKYLVGVPTSTTKTEKTAPVKPNKVKKVRFSDDLLNDIDDQTSVVFAKAKQRELNKPILASIPAAVEARAIKKQKAIVQIAATEAAAKAEFKPKFAKVLAEIPAAASKMQQKIEAKKPKSFFAKHAKLIIGLGVVFGVGAALAFFAPQLGLFATTALLISTVVTTTPAILSGLTIAAGVVGSFLVGTVGAAIGSTLGYVADKFSSYYYGTTPVVTKKESSTKEVSKKIEGEAKVEKKAEPKASNDAKVSKDAKTAEVSKEGMFKAPVAAKVEPQQAPVAAPAKAAK